MALDDSTRTAWVTSTDTRNENGTVRMIDMRSRTVTRTVEVGREPHGVAVDAESHTVWVANMDDDSVSVIKP